MAPNIPIVGDVIPLKRPLQIGIPNNDNLATLNWWCKRHKDILKYDYGLVPNKNNHGWKFPDNISDKFMSDWIRGFFDSDGSISVHKNDKGTFSIQ